MTDDLFSDFVHVPSNGSPGSISAARELSKDPDRLSELQTRIYFVVKHQGKENGMTRKEISDWTGIIENSVNGRVSELLAINKLVELKDEQGKNILRGKRSILRAVV